MYGEQFQLAFVGPGGPELLVVMLVLILMFGAKDAPRVFRKINSIFSRMRHMADSVKREVLYGDLYDQSMSDELCNEAYDLNDEELADATSEDSEDSADEQDADIEENEPEDGDAKKT